MEIYIYKCLCIHIHTHAHRHTQIYRSLDHYSRIAFVRDCSYGSQHLNVYIRICVCVCIFAIINTGFWFWVSATMISSTSTCMYIPTYMHTRNKLFASDCRCLWSQTHKYISACTLHTNTRYVCVYVHIYIYTHTQTYMYHPTNSHTSWDASPCD